VDEPECRQPRQRASDRELAAAAASERDRETKDEEDLAVHGQDHDPVRLEQLGQPVHVAILGATVRTALALPGAHAHDARMRRSMGGGAVPRGAVPRDAVPRDGAPSGLAPPAPPPGELEEIEWTEADEAPPAEPFRWLAGDDVPARFAAYAVGSRDPTGTAGMWLAIEGLSGRPGHGAARHSPVSGVSPG
jgi:hypothetical protein